MVAVVMKVMSKMASIVSNWRKVTCKDQDKSGKEYVKEFVKSLFPALVLIVVEVERSGDVFALPSLYLCLMQPNEKLR